MILLSASPVPICQQGSPKQKIESMISFKYTRRHSNRAKRVFKTSYKFKKVTINFFLVT